MFKVLPSTFSLNLCDWLKIQTWKFHKLFSLLNCYGLSSHIVFVFFFFVPYNVSRSVQPSPPHRYALIHTYYIDTIQADEGTLCLWQKFLYFICFETFSGKLFLMSRNFENFLELLVRKFYILFSIIPATWHRAAFMYDLALSFMKLFD